MPLAVSAHRIEAALHWHEAPAPIDKQGHGSEEGEELL